MKKLFFIAAIASAALVSCTKNEVNEPATQQEISFSTPVVGNLTKGSLSGNVYLETHGNFKVYAWYHEGDYVQANASGYHPYMTDVTVTYDSSKSDATPGSGAWVTSPTYYWPKNKDSKLSFDAYYPATGITGTITAKPEAGLKIENFVVAAECKNQIDVLVSERAWNKENSTSGTNPTYDGVDIMFKHVMSSINFTVATADNYGANTIKVKSITVKADGKGTFKQNVTAANDEHPFWEAQSENTTYAVLSNADAATSVQVSGTVQSIGTEAILLPQDFNTGKTVITIEYYITNNDEAPLLQTATFDLKPSGYEAKETENGTVTTVTVKAWEMGKKYTYNIVFSLNDIYFAPAVTDWVDVSSEDFGI